MTITQTVGPESRWSIGDKYCNLQVSFDVEFFVNMAGCNEGKSLESSVNIVNETKPISVHVIGKYGTNGGDISAISALHCPKTLFVAKCRMLVLPPSLPCSILSMDLISLGLTDLPHRYANLKNLKRLAIHENSISKLPDCISKMYSLEMLLIREIGRSQRQLKQVQRSLLFCQDHLRLDMSSHNDLFRVQALFRSSNENGSGHNEEAKCALMEIKQYNILASALETSQICATWLEISQRTVPSTLEARVVCPEP